MSRPPRGKRASAPGALAALGPAAVWPGAGPPERLEVAVRPDGSLPVPRLIVHLLDLVPGDLLTLEPVPGGLELHPFRELMRQGLYASALEMERAASEMQIEKLGVVSPSATLCLMREVFACTSGETLVWEVEDLGGRFRLSVRRKEAAGAGPEPEGQAARRTREPEGEGGRLGEETRPEPGREAAEAAGRGRP